MSAAKKFDENRLATILMAPIISEKATSVAEKNNQVLFKVLRDARKPEIKAAVEKLFNVKVATVRTVNVEGKERRRGKYSGYLPDWKKAYVRLKAGEKVPDFAAEI